MGKPASRVGRALIALAAAAAIGACSSSSRPAAATRLGGTVTVVEGAAFDYLDPALAFNTESAEATWLTYTRLYTYAHKNGVDWQLK